MTILKPCASSRPRDSCGHDCCSRHLSAQFLIQIDCVALLPLLFQRIIIPNAVMQELRDARAPEKVSNWVRQPPAWIEVMHIASSPVVQLLALGIGEREAIQLSEELNAELLLIDEQKGRQEAKRRGLMTTGTLGVLLAAADEALIDAHAAYQRLLTETTFRISAALESQFLERVRAKP